MPIYLYIFLFLPFKVNKKVNIFSRFSLPLILRNHFFSTGSLLSSTPSIFLFLFELGFPTRVIKKLKKKKKKSKKSHLLDLPFPWKFVPFSALDTKNFLWGCFISYLIIVYSTYGTKSVLHFSCFFKDSLRFRKVGLFSDSLVYAIKKSRFLIPSKRF